MIKQTLLLFIAIPNLIFSQKFTVPIEVFSSSKEFHYQHVISNRIDSSRFSFFNLTTFSTEYKSFRTNNTYLISNLITYDFSSKWALGAGGGISSGGEFLSIGVRYLYYNDRFTFAYFPNLMYMGEMLGVNRFLIEYKPWQERKVNPYFRFQIITSTNRHGHTNYANLFRIGIEHNKLKLGIGTPWFNSFTIPHFTSKQFGLFINRSF